MKIPTPLPNPPSLLTLTPHPHPVWQVGKEQSEPLDGMRAEHCRRTDSTVSFTTSNYAIRTTSQIEHAFVVEPSDSKLQSLGLSEWPTEEGSSAAAAGGARSGMRYSRQVRSAQGDDKEMNAYEALSTSQPSTSQPSTSQPSASHPSTSQPSTSQPSTSQP